MAAAPSSSASRLKLAAIPLLVGLLGYVLWSNFASSSPSDASSIADAAAPAAASPAPLAASPAPSLNTPAKPDRPARVPWPKFTTEQILATNPFQASPAMQAALRNDPAQQAARAVKEEAAPIDDAPAEEDRWARLAASLPASSPSIYLESSKGPALKVGSRIFHVGDEIADGYRVKQIRPDGIVVEAAPAGPDAP